MMAFKVKRFLRIMIFIRKDSIIEIRSVVLNQVRTRNAIKYVLKINLEEFTHYVQSQ